MKKLLTPVSMLLVLGTAVPTLGGTLRAQPNYPIALAQGWDPLFPEENKAMQNCFQHRSAGHQIGSVDSFNEYFLESRKQLEQLTRMSLKVAGKGSMAVGKLSVAAAYDREASVLEQSRTVIWTLSGQRAYFPENAGEVDLSLRGEKILERAVQAQNPELFFRSCGRSIVSSIQRESSILIVYQFLASSSESAEKIRASLRGRFSGASVSASASADFLQEIKNFDSQVQMSIQVYQSGRNQSSVGVETVLNQEAGNLNAVRNAMANVLKEISYNSSPIVRFNYERVSAILGLPLTSDRYELMQYLMGRIEKNRQALDAYKRKLSAVDLLLSNQGSQDYVLDPEQIPTLKQEKELLEEAIYGTLQLIETCANAVQVKDCTVNEAPLVRGLTKYVKKPYARLLAWTGRASGGYNSHSERIEASAVYFPLVDFKNLDLIERVEILINGQVAKTLLGKDLEKINQQTKSLEAHLSRSQRSSTYCWRGRWGEDCNPWAANSARLLNENRALEGNQRYELVIIDIDGNKEVLSLGNAHSAPFIN